MERGRRKWVRHNLSNAIVYGGLFHGAVRLPLPVLLTISGVGNALAVRLLRSTVVDIADNYEKALGAGPSEARRIARQVFFSYGRTTIDVWRCRSGQPELFPPISSREVDRQRLFSARSNDGRGFLLVSAHVGNWEMGAVALRSHGLTPAVLGQPELDPDVQRMRRTIREQLGVESIDVGSSMATAIRVRSAVERGAVVALVADRAYEDDHVEVPFFGRPTRYLRSPALLARFCDCPILPGVFVRSPDGSYRSLWGDLLRADPAADPDDDAMRLMGAVATFVEGAVREVPAQWYNFFRYWGEEPSQLS